MNILQRTNLQKVDVLKLDIEGYEMHALKGAAMSLAAGKVSAIYMELSGGLLARSGTSPNECLSFLQQCDFDVYYCKPPDLQALAVRQSAVTRFVNNKEVTLSPVRQFSATDHTDILALHRTAASAHDFRISS